MLQQEYQHFTLVSVLHIITVQTEIEKFVTVAVNDTDYDKIRGE